MLSRHSRRKSRAAPAMIMTNFPEIIGNGWMGQIHSSLIQCNLWIDTYHLSQRIQGLSRRRFSPCGNGSACPVRAYSKLQLDKTPTTSAYSIHIRPIPLHTKEHMVTTQRKAGTHMFQIGNRDYTSAIWDTAQKILRGK